MGTGIGEYCKRCGEQLNYDDGFEDGFCNRCYHIAKFEAKNVSERAFTREELETLYTLTSDAYIDSPDLRSSIMSKLSKLLKEKGDE